MVRWHPVRRTGLAILLLLLAAGCAGGVAAGRKEADAVIAALPWPADGIYAMHMDGYLGYLTGEKSKNFQVPFIQLSRNGPAENVEPQESEAVTASGETIGLHCRVLPGRETTRVFRLRTLSCRFGDNLPAGIYRLAEIRFQHRGQTVRLVNGYVLQVVAGTPPEQIDIVRWTVTMGFANRYLVRIRNVRAESWRVGPLLGREHFGRIRVSGVSADPPVIDSGQQGMVQVTIAGEETMVAFRPLLQIQSDGGDTRILPMKATYYNPSFSARDILQFTRDPDHLRRFDQRIKFSKKESGSQ